MPDLQKRQNMLTYELKDAASSPRKQMPKKAKVFAQPPEVTCCAVWRHKSLQNLGTTRPTVGSGAFIAPSATLCGRVDIGEKANIWYGAVLRGEFLCLPSIVCCPTSFKCNGLSHLLDGKVQGDKRIFSAD